MSSRHERRKKLLSTTLTWWPMSAKHEHEAVVEKYLTEKVRVLGGLTVKMAPTRSGMPDRLVIMPGGRMYLVELKATNGRLSPLQEHFIEVVSILGLTVYVLFSRNAVEEWLRVITEQAYRDEHPTTAEDMHVLG